MPQKYILLYTRLQKLLPPPPSSFDRWIIIAQSRKYFTPRMYEHTYIHTTNKDFRPRSIKESTANCDWCHSSLVRYGARGSRLEMRARTKSFVGFSSQYRFYAVTRIRIRGLKEIAMRVSRGTDTTSDFRAPESDEEKRDVWLLHMHTRLREISCVTSEFGLVKVGCDNLLPTLRSCLRCKRCFLYIKLWNY